jgi:tetratricopeptide (TPR) repeat protein
LIAVAILAYARSFSVPFFFDDFRAVPENPTIRNLAAIGTVLSPSTNSSGVSGRPVVNLSLAINYALGGTAVAGYHATNLALHLLASLVLLGVVRRTLRQPGAQHLAPTPAREWLALSIAAIWSLHALQTESVTCVVQRTELLVGLFLLLTLYCFIRAVEAPAERHWPVLAVGAALLGMGSKEVMVAAPILVFLHDRTFIAGSFHRAWAARGRLHLAIASTSLLLFFLVFRGSAARGTAAGFGLGMPWTHYAMKQCEAILLYLKLSFWPHPLVLDYGTDVVTRWSDVWPQAIAVLGLAVASLVALWRWPVWGFLGSWFFAILAPSSSVLPLVTQTTAEHRMYLPLAAPVAALAGILFAVAGRKMAVATLLVATACAALTAHRNSDYRSELAIWTDTVAKRPGNPRAQINLADVLLRSSPDLARVIAHYETALKLDPNHADAHRNLASVLQTLPGRQEDAVDHFVSALRLRPRFPEAHIDLGKLLVRLGRGREAVPHFETALQQRADYIDPAYFADAHVGLGVVLSDEPKEVEAAMAHFEAALHLAPAHALAHYNLGNLLARSPSRLDDAIHHYRTACRLAPDLADAHYNLGNALLKVPGQAAGAIESFQQAARARPGFADAYYNWGTTLIGLERFTDAEEPLRRLVELSPQDVDGRLALSLVMVRLQRRPEALAVLQAGLRLAPENARLKEALRRMEATPVE